MAEVITNMKSYDKIPAVERAIKTWEKLAANERNSKNREEFNQHALNLKNQKVKFLRKVQTISINIQNDPNIDKEVKKEFFADLYTLKRNKNQELSQKSFQELLDNYSEKFNTKKYSEENEEHKIIESLKNGTLNTIAGKNNIALVGITKGILFGGALAAFSYMKIGGQAVNAIKVIPWLVSNLFKVNPVLGVAAGALVAVGAVVLLNKVFGKEARASLKNREIKKRFENNLEAPENEDDFNKMLKKEFNKKDKANNEFLKAEKDKQKEELKAEILSTKALEGDGTDYKTDDFYKKVNGTSSYMNLCAAYGNYFGPDEVKGILEETVKDLNAKNKQVKIDNLDKILKETTATDKAAYEGIYKDAETSGLSKEAIEKVFADNRATLPKNWSKELVSDAGVKNTVKKGYTKFIEDYNAAMTELLRGNVSKSQANIKLQELKKASNLTENSKDVLKTKELFETMIEVYEELSKKSAEILKDQKTQEELKAKGLDSKTLEDLIKQ